MVGNRDVIPNAAERERREDPGLGTRIRPPRRIGGIPAPAEGPRTAMSSRRPVLPDTRVCTFPADPTQPEVLHTMGIWTFAAHLDTLC